MKSLHFLPPEPIREDVPKAPQRAATSTHVRKSKRQKQPATVPANAIEVFGSALRDIEIVREKLRGLVASYERHGDLQVALSACRRIEHDLTVLILAEEN